MRDCKLNEERDQRGLKINYACLPYAMLGSGPAAGGK
jgi:hypothetical protein